MYYGVKRALADINLNIPKCCITAFIGPSGCGKSTLLRCLNRLNDLLEDVRIMGTIRIAGEDIYCPQWQYKHCLGGYGRGL
ncbi:ATP-binding cassette domain-containing protein [Candidatus Magnetobacterium casensis]|uniref:ATP-binding cassette domain-containing protein n=1 Tax=Candidatus Magnetobacterium casense TaxID=1455061 RepID=A0ABS6S0G6_9BACT|nr:ATP-binding cassette domain-containing protein [Candidatus Magnetobacterium casensis]MBV6341883.1 ATP-binding cassette domain-containing protein [Candidatus Magnetobacterium casensis]